MKAKRCLLAIIVSCLFSINEGSGCGGVVNNILESPGYPSDYQNSMDCVYTVNITHGMMMNIYFADFDVEYSSTCSYDYLEIVNDNNQNFGKYCGQITGHSVLVTGQYAVISFHSDGSVRKRGYQLHFSFYVSSRFLLFAEGRNIRRLPLLLNVNTSSRIPLTTSPSLPVALDYNFQDEKVYWTDVSLHTISRAFLNGSSQEIIASSRIHNPYGLAVDSFGQNIYWTDNTKDTIEVASLNGLYRRVLIKHDLQIPVDIALDVTRGIMYWTDWGTGHERIEKADMDGQNRSIIIHSGIHYPNGLALDLTRNWLYWIDHFYHKLEVYEFPTNTRRQIISSQVSLLYPIGLALHDNHLFWTSRQHDGIYRADRETGGNIMEVLSTQSHPMLIHAYDRNITITPVTDQCNDNNGGCSQLCLLTPIGRKCSCSDSQSLGGDEKTCQQVFQKFLLFADANNAELLVKSLDGSYTEAGAVPIPQYFNISRPVALDLDIRDNRIYWTDVTLDTISRVFINGSSPEVLVSVNVSIPGGLAIDPLGGIIYWTDAGTDKIEVSRLDGSVRKILINQSLDRPRDIILDLNKGLMYWCDIGIEHKIEVANMDGNDRKLLVSRGLYWPNGLTLDHTNNWLYWMDAGYHALKYYDLENHVIQTLLISNIYLPHPFGLTLLEGYLYWTDRSAKTVYRTEKATPQNITTVANYLGEPMDIHAYDKHQTFSDHPCSLSYGGCSHLCLLRPDGYHCACPDQLAHGEVCFTSLITSSSPSVSPSTSPSVSASVSPSRSPSVSVSMSASMPASVSPSVSASVSASMLLSVSPSLSPSVSPSVSSSVSMSMSPSTSSSVSLSTSPSVSPLLSASTSASVSPSASASVSPSISPSVSASVSALPLMSPSTSLSVSVSLSVSASASPSVSPSTSVSASLSASMSSSVSASVSPSVSISVSMSVSPSTSPSVSSSETSSVSPSDSPPVSPTSPPSVSTPTSTCRLGTCKNGGTCISPGYFCNCKRYFAWHDCSVNVASSALEMLLALVNENQWKETQFKIAVANACTKFFCKSEKCESAAKSGRARRSERAIYFKPSDVIIIGTSFAKDNNFKVEFAVLFPSEDGNAPKVTSPNDIVQMVEEAKQSIEEAAGGTIQSVVPKEIITETPTDKEPNQPTKGAKSTVEKGSSTWHIAAGVGVTFVVMGILLAFVVYRMRSKLKRRPNDRQRGRDFLNPAFSEDPIYESIPDVTGSSVPINLRQATDAGLQNLHFPNDRRNEVTNTIPISNGLYDVIGGDSDVRKIDDSKKRYATPGGNREERYAGLFPPAFVTKPSKGSENSTTKPVRNDEEYMKLANAQYRIALDMAGTKTDEEDYLKPVDGHYRIPRHNGVTKNAVYENTKFQRDESQV